MSLSVKNMLGGGKENYPYIWGKYNIVSYHFEEDVEPKLSDKTYFLKESTTSNQLLYSASSYTLDADTGVYTLINPSAQTITHGSTSGIAVTSQRYFIVGEASGVLMGFSGGSVGVNYLRAYKDVDGVYLKIDSGQLQTYSKYTTRLEPDIEYVTDVTSNDAKAYPTDGVQDGFYYKIKTSTYIWAKNEYKHVIVKGDHKTTDIRLAVYSGGGGSTAFSAVSKCYFNATNSNYSVEYRKLIGRKEYYVELSTSTSSEDCVYCYLDGDYNTTMYFKNIEDDSIICTLTKTSTTTSYGNLVYGCSPSLYKRVNVDTTFEYTTPIKCEYDIPTTMLGYAVSKEPTDYPSFGIKDDIFYTGVGKYSWDVSAILRERVYSQMTVPYNHSHGYGGTLLGVYDELPVGFKYGSSEEILVDYANEKIVPINPLGTVTESSWTKSTSWYQLPLSSGYMYCLSDTLAVSSTNISRISYLYYYFDTGELYLIPYSSSYLASKSEFTLSANTEKIGSVSSDNENKFPNGGEQDGYYYVRKGEDVLTDTIRITITTSTSAGGSIAHNLGRTPIVGITDLVCVNSGYIRNPKIWADATYIYYSFTSESTYCTYDLTWIAF